MTGELTCVTWNVLAPVPVPIRFTGQAERMDRIPNVLVDQLDSVRHVDVCAVQESIFHNLHSRLRKGMQRAGFVYESKKLVGSLSDLKLVEGGVVIFSRHPIVGQDSWVFEGACDKEDCLSAKGVVYVRVLKNGCTYHVFSLHLNSWESPKSQMARRGQMEEVGMFVTRQDIPASEPVVLIGDFNVDLYSQQRQIRALCSVAGFEMLPRHKDTAPFSSDPATNRLMGIDDSSAYSSDAYPGGCRDEYMSTMQCVCCPQEWLDYGMYSRSHAAVDTSRSWMRVVPVKAKPFTVNVTMTVRREIRDLSDHYPLVAHYVFPDLTANPDAAQTDEFLSPAQYDESVIEADRMKTGLRIVPIMLYLLIGATMVAALVAVCIYFGRYNEMESAT